LGKNSEMHTCKDTIVHFVRFLVTHQWLLVRHPI
jgi:hypothetical protein